jgi:hypothetical protein
MTLQTSVPARLFVFLARNNSVGVILRRGPSDWVQMIRWDTRKDVFTPGQWFHGRIYERKCDLSPDGKRFVYDAYKPGNALANPDYGDRWTAVSKPPYFTALCLWTHKKFHGGGGYFENNKTLQLNLLSDHWKVHPSHQPHHLNVNPVDPNVYMRNSVFHYNLLHNGWKPLSYPKYNKMAFWSKHKITPQFSPKYVLQKWVWQPVTPLRLICQLSFHYRLVEYHGTKRKSLYEIVPQYSYSVKKWLWDSGGVKNLEHVLPDVTWADWDQQRRPVLAKEGKIFTFKFNEADDLIFTELADFNANQPEAIESPDWAKKW